MRLLIGREALGERARADECNGTDGKEDRAKYEEWRGDKTAARSRRTGVHAVGAVLAAALLRELACTLGELPLTLTREARDGRGYDVPDAAKRATFQGANAAETANMIGRYAEDLRRVTRRHEIVQRARF